MTKASLRIIILSLTGGFMVALLAAVHEESSKQGCGIVGTGTTIGEVRVYDADSEEGVLCSKHHWYQARLRPVNQSN